MHCIANANAMRHCMVQRGNAEYSIQCKWTLSLTCCILFYQGRQKYATVEQQRLGHELMQDLRELISPYFLRRTVEDVSMVDSGQSSSKDESAGRAAGANKYVMVWLYC